MIIPRTAKVLRALVEPETVIRTFLKQFSLGSFEFRLAFDAFRHPAYAHGIYEAARLALLLKQPAISVVEFGVAQGSGLVAMEEIAREIRKKYKIQIDIIGFDSGAGLPSHEDYRDLPYVWRHGFYKMDVAAVKSRLTTARLILGDVRETVPSFLTSGSFAPIGFISFDLDYYSSTVGAFRIFEGADASYLPRVLTYFDDIMSGDQQYSCEDVGELLAIREFNEKANQHHRIRPLYGWRRSLLLRSEWADAMWAYHRFDHRQYNEYIGG
jgi:hypothetical protein